MNSLLLLLVKSVYFIFPAYIANMVPVIVAKLKFLDFLDKPVDFNRKIKNRPILGRNKTIRGFIFGVFFSIVFVYIQKYLYNFIFFNSISILDYNKVNLLLLGFLLGFGALFGDTFETFIKRRLNKKPGSKFIPWDQLDYIIGSLLFVSFFYFPGFKIIVILLIISPFLTMLINIISYRLKIKSVYW